MKRCQDAGKLSLNKITKKKNILDAKLSSDYYYGKWIEY